jgi:hypothetical protein
MADLFNRNWHRSVNQLLDRNWDLHRHADDHFVGLRHLAVNRAVDRVRNLPLYDLLNRNRDRSLHNLLHWVRHAYLLRYGNVVRSVNWTLDDPVNGVRDSCLDYPRYGVRLRSVNHTLHSVRDLHGLRHTALNSHRDGNRAFDDLFHGDRHALLDQLFHRLGHLAHDGTLDRWCLHDNFTVHDRWGLNNLAVHNRRCLQDLTADDRCLLNKFTVHDRCSGNDCRLSICCSELLVCSATLNDGPAEVPSIDHAISSVECCRG